MNRITLEDFRNDPELRRRLFEEAHRERAKAVLAGLLWLRKRLTPRSRPPHWLARLG